MKMIKIKNINTINNHNSSPYNYLSIISLDSQSSSKWEGNCRENYFCEGNLKQGEVRLGFKGNVWIESKIVRLHCFCYLRVFIWSLWSGNLFLFLCSIGGMVLMPKLSSIFLSSSLFFCNDDCLMGRCLRWVWFRMLNIKYIYYC